MIRRHWFKSRAGSGGKGMPQKEKSFFWQIGLAKRWKTLLEKFVLPTFTCKICFEKISPQSWLSLSFPNAAICNKCFRSFTPQFTELSIEGIPTLAIYRYDETIREKLFQLKGCFDFELASVFLTYFARDLHRKFRNFVLVPAPSWEEDDKQREFNHVEEIFREMKLPMHKALIKTENIKQADLNFEQRQQIQKRIRLSPNADVRGKNILFVDDVLTTGATAKTAVSLLRNAGARKIQILVMSKTQKPEEKTKISLKETKENSK